MTAGETGRTGDRVHRDDGRGARSEHPTRILIIEDDERLRESLARWLAGEGYDVRQASTGEEGLETLEGEAFDLVLLDMKLPGMHGLDVLETASADRADTDFVMMSAEGGMAAAVTAMRAGAFDLLQKPLDPEDLSRVLARALRRRRLRGQEAPPGHKQEDPAGPGLLSEGDLREGESRESRDADD